MVMWFSSLPSRSLLLAATTILILIGFSIRSLAYSESYASPKELIDRSDFIVIGHVVGETFPKVENDPSQDFHATLVITESLKGVLPMGKTPIVIRSDLKPVPSQSDLILVGGGMHGPVSGNIRQDRIWFLRLADPKENGQSTIGISRGQDTQDLEMKPFYLAFMSADPLEVLRKYTVGNTQLAQQSRAYVTSKDIERISQIPDLDERMDKLLPYYLQGQDPRGLATRQIIACGAVAIKRLVPLYQKTSDESAKIGIISTLTQMGYRDADPLLASMLEKEDQFWARQYVRGNSWWWAEEPDPSSEQARNASKARMDTILAALNGTHDPHALEVISLVNKRWQNWQGFLFANPDP